MNNDECSEKTEKELMKLGYWNDLYSQNDYFGSGQTILANFAKEIIEKNSLKNILEVGCGQGRDSIYFAKLGYDVVAFDLSKNAIKFVEKVKKEENLKNLQLFVHDAQKIFNFQNLKFDLVYSNLALQFFNKSQLEKIFSNISDKMGQNSFFLFSTKKAGDKYFDFGTKIGNNAFEYKGIIRFFFNKDELEKLLKQNFEIKYFDEDNHENSDNTVSVWWKILVKKI